MPPGSPHQVITTEPSVTVGGHFWSPKTLQHAIEMGMALNYPRWQKVSGRVIHDSNASHDHIMVAIVMRYVAALLSTWEPVMSAWKRTKFSTFAEYTGPLPQLFAENDGPQPWEDMEAATWAIVGLVLAPRVWASEEDDERDHDPVFGSSERNF